MRLAGGWSVVEMMKIEISPRPVTKEDARKREQKLVEECDGNLNTNRAYTTEYERKIRLAELSAKWRSENPEREKALNAEWRAKNPEKVKAITAKWRAKNPEKMKALTARWREKNPEKERANVAKWRAKNLEKVRAREAKYRTENAEKVKARKAKSSAERITCEVCSAEICRGAKTQHMKRSLCRAAAAESKKENREDAKV